MNDVLAYLQIPQDYDGNRFSLSWSASGDAVERPDGTTFAMASQIALFIEGYASIGPLIHFSYILYLLEQFETKPTDSTEPGLPRLGPGRELVDKSESLSKAFRAAGSPHRNAGALCAWLCRDIPPVVSPPDPLEVYYRLAHGSLAPRLAVRRESTATLSALSDSRPLSGLDFPIRFLNALRKLSSEDISSWLENGRSASPFAGDRVADTIEAFLPKTLEEVIASLEDRERLASAVPMVAQFLSALTLPPRRLAHQALPTGGYADVATRGRPEQILPSQFAIDNIEFLRRFAENELLYFHREEPHTPLTEDLILVLDQGVRTWGKVRHALAASALALAKLASRKKIRLLLSSTGVEGRIVDPLLVEDESLGSFWESSDLTLNPSLALEQVLRTPTAARRDLIVLTHRRNVAEPEFVETTGLLDEASRLFTVAIDEPGAVFFREWRRRVPLKLADFRVDFNPPSSARKQPVARPLADPRAWNGDVELVPFPFRIGVTHRIDRPLFDFDESGRWLLLSTHRGLLHAWSLDGSAAEVLPRAMVNGSVLEQVDAVLGVANGFVVCGRVGKWLVAMHYNIKARTAKAYVLTPTIEAEWSWFYFRDLHTVALSARGKDYRQAIDLYTQEIHEPNDPQGQNQRTNDCCELLHFMSESPPRLPIVETAVPQPERGGFVRFDRTTGEILLERVSPTWPPFIPKVDGRPILKGAWLDYAQLRGNVLALLVSETPENSRGSILRLFRTHQPDDTGHPLTSTRELPACSGDPSSLMLSHDGQLIARKLGERQLEVRETGGVGQTVFVSVKGKSHTDPKVTLGRYGLIIHVGKQSNLIRWDRDKLTVSTVAEGSTRSEHDIVTWPLDRPATRNVPLPKVLMHDPHRFVACARGEALTAVVDGFGQVALFDRSERLIAMFVAFRSHVAAWTPDGTRFGLSHGNSPLLDGPATPDAAEIIGRTLKEASERAIDQDKLIRPASSR